MLKSKLRASLLEKVVSGRWLMASGQWLKPYPKSHSGSRPRHSLAGWNPEK